MYLVLLALLAMNVSKEILHSFVIINDGLEETTMHFEHKIDATYNKFERLLQSDRQKVKPFYDRAKMIADDAEEIDELLEEIKIKIIAQADKITEEQAKERPLEKVENKDNQEVGTFVLVGSDKSAMWKEGTPQYEYSAGRLKKMIAKFNSEVTEALSLQEGETQEDVQIPLGPVKMHELEEEWEIANFYHLPLAAIVTNLSRFQADIRNIEAEVLRRLMSDITADDFKFDTLEAKVIPQNGTYITVGDSFKAQVIVAAYSTTSDPKLEMAAVKDGKIQGLDSVKMELAEFDTNGVTIENGVASYSFVPTTPGDYEWGGLIKIKGPRGNYKPYKFTSSFKAAKPSLVVSPTKMNVFYKGLANPVEISAAGMSPADLTLSVSGCQVKTISKAEGKYEVIPSDNLKSKEVNVAVRASGPNAPNFKPIKYRIKPVPLPVASYMGKKGSFKMSKAQASSGQFVSAVLEDFLFDLKFRVTSYKMVVSSGGKSTTYPGKGNRITPQMKSTMNKMRKGQNIIIKDIVAQRSDGGPKKALESNIIIELD